MGGGSEANQEAVEIVAEVADGDEEECRLAVGAVCTPHMEVHRILLGQVAGHIAHIGLVDNPHMGGSLESPILRSSIVAHPCQVCFAHQVVLAAGGSLAVDSAWEPGPGLVRS